MKIKLIIAALMLVLAFPAAADRAVVQEAYEVALSDLRLPRAEGGTLAFKECDSCEYRRMRVNSTTAYMVNGERVTLQKFRQAMAGVQDRDNEAATVLHHVKLSLVTSISVYL